MRKKKEEEWEWLIIGVNFVLYDNIKGEYYRFYILVIKTGNYFNPNPVHELRMCISFLKYEILKLSIKKKN